MNKLSKWFENLFATLFERRHEHVLIERVDERLERVDEHGR